MQYWEVVVVQSDPERKACWGVGGVWDAQDSISRKGGVGDMGGATKKGG